MTVDCEKSTDEDKISGKALVKFKKTVRCGNFIDILLETTFMVNFR
jgi:hypothetical protein